MSDTMRHAVSNEAMKRLEALRHHLCEISPVAIAYSGGVDSTFLLAVAHETLGCNAIAVTSAGRVVPERDIQRTRDFCAKRDIAQIIVHFDELSIPGFAQNEPDRCYHCKKALFAQMIDAAAESGHTTLVDGSNKDDEGDYRPGMRALEEMGVSSPLREVGLTKAQIRELSRAMGLPTWDMPSAACLASRVAYGEVITAVKLKRVELAEDYLHDQGFTQLRVRVHGVQGELARIEVDTKEIERLAQASLRQRIVDHLRELGFTYVSLDLVGFRSGAMNEVL